MAHVQEVLERSLRNLTEQCEDLWIERTILRELLTSRGVSEEQLENLAKQAKSNPSLREQARQAFSLMQQSIEAARLALIESLLREHPPSDKVN